MKKIISVIILMFAATMLNAQNEDAAFREIAGKVSSFRNKMKNGTIAVFPFETHGFSDSAYGTYAADKMSAAISAAGKLKLVDRDNLGSLMKEKELSMSGIIEQDEAARIGTLLSIDSILIGRIYRTDDGTDIMVKLVDSKSGEVLTLVSAKYKDSRKIIDKKKGTDFEGVWKVTTTAPYLVEQGMKYEKLVLEPAGTFTLHLINNADRVVEIQGAYRLTGNNIDYRPQRMFFDGEATSFTRRSDWMKGTIYLMNGKLYFNYTGKGKGGERYDAMNSEFRCVAERVE